MMPMATALRSGDSYPCPRCGTPHLVEQPYLDRSTAERNHLYVTCRGAHYFVGVAPRHRDDSQVGPNHGRPPGRTTEIP